MAKRAVTGDDGREERVSGNAQRDGGDEGDDLD